jgi:membrane-bound lytic murein transglycosylase D
MNLMTFGILFLVAFSAQTLKAETPQPLSIETREPASVAIPLEGYWSRPDFTEANLNALGYTENSFTTPAALKKDVQFWIEIYTKYTTRQGVFHLTGETDQVLGEIDLTDVYANQKWGPIRREKEAELIVRIQKKLIAKKFKIKNIKQIRLQMGLKDRMQEAILKSGLYLPMIEKVFQEEKLPLELSRLVFVESSFNIEAGSKVGASGLWQIMPRVARKYKYIQLFCDKHSHAYYSTKLAARILKENYNILKSWPLAVTAYNHGVGSLRKIVKKYGSNDIGFLAENVKSKKSFGFASRNFYATFLAALHVETNANLYFPEPIVKNSPLVQKDFYLKKKIKFEELLSLFQGDREKLKLYNPQIKSKYLKVGKIIPPKTLISLPSSSSERLGYLEEINPRSGK